MNLMNNAPASGNEAAYDDGRVTEFDPWSGNAGIQRMSHVKRIIGLHVRDSIGYFIKGMKPAGLMF